MLERTHFVVDQMGRQISLSKEINRIVSLVPSQTELLFELGLGHKVVGRTKFCVHPAEEVKKVPIIGGTKQQHVDKIMALAPDIIIGNKEENQRDYIEALEKRFPVWMSDIYTLMDACNMIRSIGNLLACTDKAASLAQEIEYSFERLNIVELNDKRVLYFIWHQPYMVAAGSTFIDHMLAHMGLVNAAAPLERYPALTPDEMTQWKVDFVFLSSEPFPYKEKHIKLYQDLFPNAKVLVVDGEMFSWYGSRLKLSAAYFKQLSEEAIAQ